MSKSKKPSKPKVAKKTAKTEAPAKVKREKRNGITRPGTSTLCGKVWAFLDANKGATANDAIAGIKDINESTARTQAQRYKKFHEAK